MRRRVPASLVATLVGLLGSPLSLAGQPVHIGTILDGPPGVESQLPLYRQEILTLTQGELDVHFDPRHQLVGDWTLESARAAVDALLNDPEVDLVLALGAMASHLLCATTPLPKPVIAALIVDREVQRLPTAGAGSGVPNLNYIAQPTTLGRDLAAFLEVVHFKKVATLANAQLVAAIDGLNERVRSVYAERGVDYVYVPVKATAHEALAQIPDDVEAVYLTPLTHLPRSEWQALVEGLIERSLPTFSYLGESEVKKGALAGVARETRFQRLARRVALNVQRILLGENAGDVPVSFPVRERLTLNMATARAIGFSPSWDLLVEAELLHQEDESSQRRVSLESAVEEAVQANLDLLAGSYGVEAGAENLRLARSQLLPQVDISALGAQIDTDRAKSLFVFQPARTLTGFVLLRQILFVEPLRADLVVQKHLQGARHANHETLRLDIAQAAATAYLSVLRAKALERVQRTNLRLTGSNLELARVRFTVGTAGEAEVVRWESQIARDRQRVVAARVERELAELLLNRLLHRPLEEPFLTQDVGLDDPGLTVSDERFRLFTKNPRRYATMRDFLVQEGLRAAPELVALDRLIAAEERRLRSDRRAYWTPAVELQADLSKRLVESGAGSDVPDTLNLGDSLPGLDLSLPGDTFWTVAVDASLPLGTGGARAAQVAQSRAELSELQATRQSLAEQIETRIRAALFRANGTFQELGLSQVSADAAQRNLDLVTEAYAEGSLPILDLLDAQSSALVADELAADAVYEFLIDTMEVQRAINRFDFFISKAERVDWLQRLEEFLRDSGIDLTEE